MTPPPRAALLRDSNFVWLMSGGVISALGDQFTLIALPWRVRCWPACCSRWPATAAAAWAMPAGWGWPSPSIA